MSDNGFIFMLAFAAALLVGILTVAHVSAYRLKQRLKLRRQSAALAPDPGSVFEPELDLGPDAPRFGERRADENISIQIRHAETAR
jgi:hypothetical protein